MDSILKTEHQLAIVVVLVVGWFVCEQGKMKWCLLGDYEHCLERCDNINKLL